MPEPAPDVPVLDVLVIGAGQAGLATGFWLQRLAPGLSVMLAEAAPAVGQTWRDRWDSLVLFTPRAYSALPGLPFPDGPTGSPTRLEMADYLQAYAEHFALPVRLGMRVEQVRAAAGGFAVLTSQGPLTARHVVVANGPFHDPYVPAATVALGPGVRQLHSYDYHRPADAPGPRVAVVGGGNSAAQLALELLGSRQVTWVTPGPPWFVPDHILGITSYWWMKRLGILSADADGRVSRYVRRRGDAVFGRQLVGPIERGELAVRSSPVVGGTAGALLLEDGSDVPVDTVLWCTGFHSRYDWLDVPGALGSSGAPEHTRGASPVAGLHWMGLPWQRALDSSIVHGVDADARRCVERIARWQSPADQRGTA